MRIINVEQNFRSLAISETIMMTILEWIWKNDPIDFRPQPPNEIWTLVDRFTLLLIFALSNVAHCQFIGVSCGNLFFINTQKMRVLCNILIDSPPKTSWKILQHPLEGKHKYIKTRWKLIASYNEFHFCRMVQRTIISRFVGWIYCCCPCYSILSWN